MTPGQKSGAWPWATVPAVEEAPTRESLASSGAVREDRREGAPERERRELLVRCGA